MDARKTDVSHSYKKQIVASSVGFRAESGIFRHDGVVPDRLLHQSYVMKATDQVPVYVTWLTRFRLTFSPS